MQKTLTPAERLIVAADFEPPEKCPSLLPLPPQSRRPWKRGWVMDEVLKLTDSLQGTGVYIKVNFALRACGYGLIDEIHDRGLRVFADLKLIDIDETMSLDGVLLYETRPELVTVMCIAGVSAMQALKAKLPDMEVLGVTVLTSLNEQDCKNLFSLSIGESVFRFTSYANLAGLDGIICAPEEICTLRALLKQGDTINTPGIRSDWAVVPCDDQNPERTMTPVEAIKAGADRIIVGRPITQAEKPYDAVMRTIEEIASATA